MNLLNNHWLANRFLKRQYVLEVGKPNKNRRAYPQSVVDKMLEYQKTTGGFVHGHLGFTGTSVVHFSKISHEATLFQDGNLLMVDINILDTPKGRELGNAILRGACIDYRTAGVGNGKTNADGILVIGDNYKLISIDAVTNGA